MLSDAEKERLISKLADEAIAEGYEWSRFAWHYVGEEDAREIIKDVLYKLAAYFAPRV